MPHKRRCTFGNCGALAKKMAHFRELQDTADSAQLWCGHRCAVHTIEGSVRNVTPHFQSAAAARLLSSF